VTAAGVTEGLQPAGAPGQFRLAGRAGFAEAKRLLAASRQLFAAAPAVTVDLAGLTHVDSATLALLLEWRRVAARSGKRVAYTGLPARLKALAKLSGVAALLGDGDAPDQGAASSPVAPGSSSPSA
jgi:phospholipid transport system transporter-binding protein